MTTRLPALFVSHGAPSLLLEPSPTRDFLAALGPTLPRPQGIVCISAHWTTPAPRVTAAPEPATLHDFGGFGAELEQMTYPTPGSPRLAAEVVALLEEAGFAAAPDDRRGLDHGAWVPLKLLYPRAELPVIQLSVQPHLAPAHHLALGEALRPLRDRGILLLASGSATHNLRDFFGRSLDAPMPPYVQAFDDWLCAAIAANDRAALLDYRHQGPQALQNHPTPEHFLPLLVALGAGENGRVLHRGHTYGVISMAAFAWD